MRHHHDGGYETQPRRFRGDPGDLRQLFVPLAAGAAGELPGGAVGIFGRDRRRDHDVVAERRIVEAHRLAAAHDVRKVVRGRQGSGGRCVETNQHLLRPSLHCIARVDATPCGRQEVGASASRADTSAGEASDNDGR